MGALPTICIGCPPTALRDRTHGAAEKGISFSRRSSSDIRLKAEPESNRKISVAFSKVRGAYGPLSTEWMIAVGIAAFSTVSTANIREGIEAAVAVDAAGNAGNALLSSSGEGKFTYFPAGEFDSSSLFSIKRGVAGKGGIFTALGLVSFVSRESFSRGFRYAWEGKEGKFALGTFG